jgi:hypothetical protein
MPRASFDAWEGAGTYPKGQVSFFAGLQHAVDDMLGERGDFGQNYSNDVRESGGQPVLLVAWAHRTSDAPGAEVILHYPREIARFGLSRRQLTWLRRQLEG